MDLHICSPGLGELRQENCWEFESSLGYRAWPSLKKIKAKQKRLVDKRIGRSLHFFSQTDGGMWKLLYFCFLSVNSNTFQIGIKSVKESYGINKLEPEDFVYRKEKNIRVSSMYFSITVKYQSSFCLKL